MSCKLNAMPIKALTVLLAIAPFNISYANVTVAHWINDSNQNAVTVLNAGSTFITDFKGINDLSITESSGQLRSIYTDNYAGTTPANNPDYLTGFQGNSAQGTGDGTLGHLSLLESSYNGPNSLQFDFSNPLTPADKIVIADIDYSEQIKITAYHWTGSSYVLLPLTDWTEQNFSGQTGITPNATWAAWDASLGLFTANTSNNLNEPLNVLTPSENVDRLVFTKLNTSLAASTEIQFVSGVSSVPLPASFWLLGSALAGFGVMNKNRKMAKR